MILTNIRPIAVETIAKNLFSDPLLTRNMIYKKFVSNGAYNPATGKNVPVTTDYNVVAVEMKHTQDSVKASTAKVEVGMTLYLIQYDSLPFALDTRDVLLDVDTQKEYAIKGLDPIFNILHSITVVDKRSPS